MAIAAANLASGALVAFPTETVYGLGADATNAAAVARIYSVKGRPVDHPLIVHVSSMQRMADWAEEIPTYAIALARDYWPGPMTLVFKRSTLAQDFITGGQVTIAVRVPGHVVALALLQEFENIGGRGVAAPSANRFGQVSPTTAQAVSEEIGQYLSNGDQIIDGGVCMVGVESTIIDCTSDAPRILRPGAITDAMIEQSTGLVVKTGSTFAEAKIRVSGSLENHYAPAATVLLSETPLPGQGFIALASIQTPPGVIRLASPANDQEFAQILYMALRQADVQGLAEVVVIQPIGTGIAVAIRDRLTRAANQK
jgi:L-threonylcarbamoyladenylate synthase